MTSGEFPETPQPDPSRDGFLHRLRRRSVPEPTPTGADPASKYTDYESTYAHLFRVTETLPSIIFGAVESRSVDGTEYVQEAFGGFGPGSPEYDPDQRLRIHVPDAKAAVTWFRDAEIRPGHSRTTQKFAAVIPAGVHPGVSEIRVEFTRTPETSLIAGHIETRPGAFEIPGAPKQDATGAKIDTYRPAQIMLSTHLYNRLEALYPGKVSRAGTHSHAMAIELEDGTQLCLDGSSVNYLSVTVNGASYPNFARLSSTKATPKQLEHELGVLAKHFPAIAEAYADFFRKQLPPTEITVDYKATGNTAQDPVDPDRLKKLRQELLTTPREDDFKYIGGLDADIARLRQAAIGFSNPEAFREFGVTPPRGVLLQGPPGTGKTSLANAFARDADAVMLTVKASTIKSAFHGETERNIRAVFQLADQLVAEGERVVIFIDEIESLAPARDAYGSSSIDRNVTTELLQGMNIDRKDCIIIAATNAPGMVDPALINNSSRFSEQLEIGLPDRTARTDILEKLLRKFADKSTSGKYESLFAADMRIDALAQDTEGLSGADIENAIRKMQFARAVIFASTGERPAPATYGELRSSIMGVHADKARMGGSYLRS